MSRTNTVKQAGRQAQQEVAEVDVITTTQGGEDVAKAAARSGALVGFNSHTSRPPDEIPVNFVDWPYKEEEDEADVSFIHHLIVVEREEPKYAVAPDVTEDRDFDRVVKMADELNKHADTVIMVPKSVKPDEMPDRFRVGIPFRDGFEGLPWPMWMFQDCEPLHILGGNPNRQVELAAMLPRVASLDTAHPTMSANWGKVWCGDDEGYTQKKEGYYGSIEASMSNLIKRWADDPPEARMRRSVAQKYFDIPLPDFEETERDVEEETVTVEEVTSLLDFTTDETKTVEEVLAEDAPLFDYIPPIDCCGSKEDVPHPGRAYFHEADDPQWEDGMTFGDLQAKM